MNLKLINIVSVIIIFSSFQCYAFTALQAKADHLTHVEQNMDESAIWKLLTSSKWEGFGPMDLSYTFSDGPQPTNKIVKIETPGSGVPIIQTVFHSVDINGHIVKIGPESNYFFDEKYQHLSSQTDCRDRIVKSEDIAFYQKDSTPQTWMEIQNRLKTNDEGELKEALYLISRVYGLENRVFLPEVLQLTHDPRPAVRAFAVYAGSHRVIPLEQFMQRLEEMKNDKDPWVQNEINKAIAYCSYLIRDLLDKDPSPEIQELGRELLKRM